MLENCKFIECQIGPFFQIKIKQILMKALPVNVPKIFPNEKKLVNKALQSNWVSSNGPM